MLSPADLQREAEATGFRGEALERVPRLRGLLEGFCGHSFSGSRVALERGTVLSLFVFGVPRLSVDIDLDQTRAVDRDVLLAESPRTPQAIQAACSRLGVQVEREPSQKTGAGDSWQHERITLEPVNHEFDPIHITNADEGELQVIAELVEVVAGEIPRDEG